MLIIIGWPSLSTSASHQEATKDVCLFVCCSLQKESHSCLFCQGCFFSITWFIFVVCTQSTLNPINRLQSTSPHTQTSKRLVHL